MKSSDTLLTLRYTLRCRPVRYSLGALLAIMLCALLIALAWWAPTRKEHAQLTRQIDSVRMVRADAERLQQALAAQRKVSPIVADLEKKLEVRTTQAELVQGVGRWAAQRGVRVVSQSFDEGKPQGDQGQPLYLELGLLGEYGALRRLTGDLAKLPMWIEIVEERFELTGQGGLVKAQLRLLTCRTAKEQP